MTATKDGRLPDAKELEVIPGVEIGLTVGKTSVVEIGAAEIRTRISVETMGPGVLRIQREILRELVLETGEHHVVVGATLAAERVDAAYKGVQRCPEDRSESVRV